MLSTGLLLSIVAAVVLCDSDAESVVREMTSTKVNFLRCHCLEITFSS
ncbi:unnamed protein product [Wuchereria bancrofti]|uniref:Uncharacterized protein n=1 Tax=Wuchereria bancrofti TaxID=6293 RepID=A0A3P7EQ83_WUCBA|nr:unnamed protein product [Wuchereria bancrofti]